MNKEKRTEQVLLKLTASQKNFLEDIMKETNETKLQKVIYNIIDKERVFNTK
ncbi:MULTISPECIES: hypothetical protein [Klebsiella]|uniref:hypothetical protein n=1 Tax=Klebsiella TaxID=570 RepID=UPI000A543B77|nr:MULTISPECIES: hypothetical protein [Klebsiella]ELT0602380.1 hypothetical protein [Raoultella ornithinolytica]ELT0733946.1 hypothetical protein [Raoultella ornithinolytica]HBQ5117990.1 hypothetical protein [Klebsiella variicola]HCA5513727.1 hypothetical protein [Klebsiella variicola]HCI9591171.1 hypothetical protein [Klebsiella variicola]